MNRSKKSKKSKIKQNKAKPKIKAKQETKINPKPETKIKIKAKPEIKINPKSETKIKIKAKPKTKINPKPDIKFTTVDLYNITPTLIVSKKVCVVGNSDILLRTKYGTEIDIFDDVIRFNFADTVQHKKHTGSKTTIRWVSCPISKQFATEHNKDVQTYLQYYFYGKRLFTDISVICKKKAHYYIKNFTKTATTYKPNEFYSLYKVNDYLKQLNVKEQFLYEKNCKPRTGLICILTLIKSGCRPYVYGFDTEEKPIMRHYSLNRRYIVDNVKIHQINLEIKILKELEQKNLIVVRR